MSDYQELRSEMDALKNSVQVLERSERLTDFKEAMRSELRGMEKQLEANAQLMQGLHETVSLNIQQQTKMLERHADDQNRRLAAVETGMTALETNLENKFNSKVEGAKNTILVVIGAATLLLAAVEFLAG